MHALVSTSLPFALESANQFPSGPLLRWNSYTSQLMFSMKGNPLGTAGTPRHSRPCANGPLLEWSHSDYWNEDRPDGGLWRRI